MNQHLQGKKIMKNKTVVIGVSGGIAVYKTLDVISKLKKKNVDVYVILTNNATQFVSPLSFQSLSQNLVVTDMFDEPKHWEIEHISLAKKADLFLVCPATVNILGKIANGIADDMLTTTIMATKAPVIFAPAANTNMMTNLIVKDNIDKLKNYGYGFIEPDEGRLACGDVGTGKLALTDVIADYVLKELYAKKDLVGKTVLVTAGPTNAPIDPVRYITNKSSGKMGYEIAIEARNRGANVTLVSGASSLKRPFGINVIDVCTNKEMKEAVMNNFENSDMTIMAAAVSDYKTFKYSDEKIKKTSKELIVKLIKDNDILKLLGENKKNQILVGFAAESNDLIVNAEKKLINKNLDFIVANDIKSDKTGFKSDLNKVTILSKDGKKIDLEVMEKRKVASNLFDLIMSK